jgi:hypothetical protein
MSALIGAGLFRSSHGGLCGELAAEGACGRSPRTCPTLPKKARQLHQGRHQWRACQTRPNPQPNNSGRVTYKSVTYRQIARMVALPTDLTDALFPGSRARTLHVVVCLMGSFLTIAPRGGPIKNFRQKTHLERLASIDDRPRGYRMFACDSADRSLKFVEKSVVRFLIVSRHHRCARDSPSLWGRYPAGLPPPSTR